MKCPQRRLNYKNIGVLLRNKGYHIEFDTDKEGRYMSLSVRYFGISASQQAGRVEKDLDELKEHLDIVPMHNQHEVKIILKQDANS